MIRPAPLIILIIILMTIGAVLLMTVIDMPAFGDPGAPAHHHVAPRYVAMAYKETGVENMVTAILANYRGYDTLGELTVIFTAVAAVISLVGRRDE